MSLIQTIVNGIWALYHKSKGQDPRHEWMGHLHEEALNHNRVRDAEISRRKADQEWAQKKWQRQQEEWDLHEKRTRSTRTAAARKMASGRVGNKRGKYLARAYHVDTESLLRNKPGGMIRATDPLDDIKQPQGVGI